MALISIKRLTLVLFITVFKALAHALSHLIPISVLKDRLHRKYEYIYPLYVSIT